MMEPRKIILLNVHDLDLDEDPSFVADATAAAAACPRFLINRERLRIGYEPPIRSLMLGVAVCWQQAPLELQLCLFRWVLFIEFGRSKY